MTPRMLTTGKTADVFFDFTTLSARERYKLLLATVVPRPIAWVVTLDRDGRLNAAPFSFFNAFATDPPVVGIEIGSYDSGRPKDTRSNIQESGESVINLVCEEMAQAMNITAIGFAPGVSELAEAELETRPSMRIRPPRIAGSPVAMECEVMQIVDLGADTGLVLGRVLAMHVREGAIGDRAEVYFDTPGLNLISRMHGNWYARTSDLFSMERIFPFNAYNPVKRPRWKPGFSESMAKQEFEKTIPTISLRLHTFPVMFRAYPRNRRNHQRAVQQPKCQHERKLFHERLNDDDERHLNCCQQAEGNPESGLVPKITICDKWICDGQSGCNWPTS
jgi:flavin reductase (DIM6/NTAB) family NADH-FMN oxidoreductase RutF